MTIAELFIKLGLKGGDDTRKEIEGVDKSMQGVVSSGLAVKAGLAAMAYGLQQLMSKSSEAGASINQFENSTGLSGKLLQQWQFAARQFNVEAEDMTGSIRNVQDAMTNMLLGRGAPEGFGMVANMVDIDPKKVRDTYYVLEKLQEFAKKVPADVSKSMLKSFGISEGVIAAMRQNAFKPDVFGKAPIYSDKEVKELRQINVEWDNMYDKVEKAFGKLNAEHGLDMVKDIGQIADKILILTKSLIDLSDKLYIFEGIGKAFEGWGAIIDGLNNSIEEMKLLTGDKEYQSEEGDTGATAWMKDAVMNDMNFIKSFFSDDVKQRTGRYVDPNSEEEKSKRTFPGRKDGSKTTNNSTRNSKTTNTNMSNKSDTKNETHNNKSDTKNTKIQINQTFNLKDGSDPKKIADSTKKATSDAFRQSSAQGQVN